MTARKIDKVRKRDGRVVDYDEAKLAEAIYRAARAAGHDNRYLANDLAGVVTTYLERYHDREVPSSEEIQRMVEKILFETGHREVARAYLLFRETQGRPAPPEAPSLLGELFPTEPVLVEAATRDEVSAWGRDRITAALVKEAGLDPVTAEEIAAAVEQRIFREGHRRISSILIRELVNQELLARGHASKMRRQLVVGLPKYDLDRLVRPGVEAPQAIDPDAMCRLIGETTMKQYALQELHPRAVADAHVEGRIHIHDLEYPLKVHWMALPVDEVQRGGARTGNHPLLAEPPVGARTLGAHLDARLAAAAREVSGGVELVRLNSGYAPFLAGATDVTVAEEAAHLVLQLLQRGAPRLHLGLDLGRSLDPASNRFTLEVLRTARDLDAGFVFHVPAELFSDEEGVLLLREACRVALERGRSTFVFERPGGTGRRVSRFAVRGPSEQDAGAFVIAQAVTINLPQACYRGEGGSDFYAELEVALEAAVRAHLVKRTLLRRPRGDAHEYAVGLAGLNEAVRLMCGAEMASDESALRLGIRILSFLYFRVREEAEKHGLRLALHDLGGPDAAGRFFRIDRQMFARARSLEAGPAYTDGVHLRDFGSMTADEGIASEARFHTLMTQGTARVPPETRARLAPPELFALLRRAALETLCAQVSVP
ncbi:MAG TPA: anaerobic ribonucleoside-triphosphate reductase [Planctomycetota bacterium]|nr:anaerobic ribonucleoside-triphosphate reductase [Planctomycetota bacterium]